MAQNVIRLYPVNDRAYSVAEEGGRIHLYANEVEVLSQTPKDPEHRAMIIARWLGMKEVDDA